MNNQAAQTMPPLPEPQKECWIGHKLFSADQMHQYARDYAAMLAAAPAASGGDNCEDCQIHRQAHHSLDNIVMGAGVFEVLHEGGVEPAWKNTIEAVKKLANPQPAASVSERAREIVPVGPDGGWCTRCGCGNDAANFAHLPSCNAKTPDAAARAREILIGLNQGFIGCKRDNEIITKGNAYDVFVRGDTALLAIEQALTQQRGECEICHGTGEGGGVDGDCALCGGKSTTPQPSADAVREYVTELRAQADQKMGVAGACAHDGDRARYKSAAQLLRRVADELESLLSAASGEKGVWL